MHEQRTAERLRSHYEVEKALAARLRQAAPAERRQLYTAVYDELFRRVPDHPQLTRQRSAPERQRVVARELARLRRYLRADTCFLEIGAGDCALSLQAACLVRQVYAVDVSAEITSQAAPPRNFQLILSDGTSIPVPPGTIDVAYSNQLMEHLHPDDADQQLRNVYEALVPGGIYLCLTPNRLSGPHDISRYFDPVASGFHLREYTHTELREQFRRAGFSRVGAWMSVGSHAWRLPLFPLLWLEKFLGRLPAARQKQVSHWPPLGWLLGIRLVGVK